MPERRRTYPAARLPDWKRWPRPAVLAGKRRPAEQDLTVSDGIVQQLSVGAEYGGVPSQVIPITVPWQLMIRPARAADVPARTRPGHLADELCPVRPVAPVSHGEVIEALVANRLTAPAPLVQVEARAAAMAVDEVYGIEPRLPNDDRLGRALDAIAPHLDEAIGSVGAAAISEFGVDVARLHWDMTSISLYGAYPDADEEYPAPRWGHPKDRRPDLKQIQAGLAVAAGGGIPVFHHAYDGGAGEVAQVTGAMTALKKSPGRARSCWWAIPS